MEKKPSKAQHAKLKVELNVIVRLRAPPRIGEPRTQKLKSQLVRTQSLNVLPLKPGIGQYIAMHAKLIVRDFFLAYSTLPVHSPAFFPKPLLIFPVLVLANTWFLCRPAG